MIRRPRRILPATIVAVTLLAVAVLVIVTCVQVLLGRTPLLALADIAAQAATLRWSDPPALIGGGLLALVGIVLLTCALAPGTPNVLPLDSAGDRSAAGATRSNLRRAVSSAAGRVDGVSRAGASVRPGLVRATVTTPLRDTAGLEAEVRSAVDQQLSAVTLARKPRIDVRINHSRRS